MYADDTSLCYQSDNLTNMKEAINSASALMKLDAWLQGNKLSLNVGKSHVLISTKQKHSILEGQNEALELKICNNKLDIVQKQNTLVYKLTVS